MGQAKKVGVILPDTSTSPRWEANDRPLLKAAFDSAGIQSDIQNAGGDKAKFGTLCDSMINEGVNVLLIVNLDSDSGSACLKKAQAAGIKTIDYDRLTLGGGASYYVSFDNVGVGKLMGDGLQQCLTADGKTTANIVYVNGAARPTTTRRCSSRATSSRSPRSISSGKYKLVGDQSGEWDATKAANVFEQMYTQNNGKIDGVVSANDTMAGGIIGILKNEPRQREGPGDRSGRLHRGPAGDPRRRPVHDRLQGHQEGGRRGLAAGDRADQGTDTSSIVNGTVKDTVANKDVPSALQTPAAIFKDNVKDVIADGFWTKDQICTADFAAACTAAGIS